MKRARIYSETVQAASKLLGAQIRQGRIDRAWTVVGLAERAGIDKNTVTKVEHGDPSVALGTAFDLAVLVGVPLFFEDRRQLRSEAQRHQATVLNRRVRPSRQTDIDYDF